MGRTDHPPEPPGYHVWGPVVHPAPKTKRPTPEGAGRSVQVSFGFKASG